MNSYRVCFEHGVERGALFIAAADEVEAAKLAGVHGAVYSVTLNAEGIEEALLRKQGWNGVECKLCFTRKRCITDGTWDIQFRWCPHCSASWRS